MAGTTTEPTRRETSEAIALLVATAVVLVISGIGPRDRATWFLEVAPVLIVAPLLYFTWRTFRLTPLAYRLIFVHGLILMLGGHYTYAHVPLGFWLQDMLDFARNPYDRIGHIAQGFIPAIVTREILLRATPLRHGKMLFFLVLCVCLAASAFYELIEWWTAVIFGEGAHEFLGTQGDEWDTQWDMFLALLGATASQLIFAQEHDRQLAALATDRNHPARFAGTPP
jgi:putative membrane protein